MNNAHGQKTQVCVTLPTSHLRALDRIAAGLNRSRSWVISQAVEQFIAPGAHESAEGVES